MKCTYCYANQGEYADQPSRLMTEDAAVAAVDKALERFGSVGAVKFFGGEPSTNPGVFEAVCERFTRLFGEERIDRVPRFGTISNLLIMHDRFVETVRRYDIRVTASLDGPKHVHDRLRPRSNGRGSFDTIVGNINRLQAATGQPVGVECVYTPLHLRRGLSPLEVSTFLHSLGIPQVLIHPLVDSEYLREFSDDEVMTYILGLRQLQRQNMSAEVTRLIDQPAASPAVVRGGLDLVRSHTEWHCGMGNTTFTVDVSGEAWPCYMCMGLPEHVLGNVASGDTQVDFDGFKQRRATLTKKAHPICRQCDLRDACHACLGQMMQNAPRDQPYAPMRATCEWLAGTIDGLLEGLLLALQEPARWEVLSGRLGLDPDAA